MGRSSVRIACELIREDFATHGGRLGSPGFQALVVHRLGVWRDGLPRGLARWLLKLPYDLARRTLRARYGIEVHHTAGIGRRLRLSDYGATVIGNECVLGDDCVLAAGVTMAKTKAGRPGRPAIGDRVIVGPGAAFVGGVTVGDDAIIGPNSVVFVDVKPGGIVLAPNPQVRQAGGGVEGSGTTRPDRLRPVDSRSLPDEVTIGRNVSAARPGTVRWYGAVQIGDGCVLGEAVTIGWQSRHDPRPSGGAITRLGRRVELSSGSVVLHGVFIGDDARVGPNAVVGTDVPAGASVSCPPPRVLGAIKPASGAIGKGNGA